MQPLRVVERYYDEEEKNKVGSSFSRNTRHGCDEKFRSGGWNTSSDASKGRRQHSFSLMDANAVLRKEQYYDTGDHHITRSCFSRFGLDHCQQGVSRRASHSEDYSHVTDEDLSAILDGVMRNFPQNAGVAQNSVLNEGIDVSAITDRVMRNLSQNDAKTQNSVIDDEVDLSAFADRAMRNLSQNDAKTQNSVIDDEADLSAFADRVMSFSQNAQATQNSVLYEDTDCHDARLADPAQRISLLPQNLKAIIRNAKKCQKSLEVFYEMYPIWNSNTRLILAALDEIADALDKTKLDCNIAKAVGATAGAVGTSLFVVGAALLPFTAFLSSPFVIAGTAITATAGSTSLGTAVVEVILIKNKVKEVQKLLKDYEKCFQNMCQIVDHTSDFKESVDKIMNFDDFVQFCNDLKRLYGILLRVIPQTNAGIFKRLLKTFLKRSFLPPSTFEWIVGNYEFLDLFKELIVLHHDNPLLFEVTTTSYMLFLQIARNFEAPGTTAIVEFVGTGGKVATAASRALMRKAVSQGLFAVVGLALELTSLILVSIDIHKGSKCPKAEEVRKIREMLSDEFDRVKYVFSEIKNSERGI